MKPYQKIPLIFLLLGVIWILASDQIVRSISDSFEELTAFQTIKGWLFVILSSALVYFLTRRACRAQEKHEAEKMLIFEKTLEGSHHILLNYLNQMQLITQEAESCPEFDPSILSEGRKITFEAKGELERLRKLQFCCPHDIDATIYQNLRN